MDIDHRMLNRTNGNSDYVILYFVYRNVLLNGCISCACDDLFHRLSAANDRNSCFLDYSDHLTAMFAFIEFHIHSYIPPRKQGYSSAFRRLLQPTFIILKHFNQTII